MKWPPRNDGHSHNMWACRRVIIVDIASRQTPTNWHMVCAQKMFPTSVPGMYTRDLTPTAYSALISRGWRRCGTYVYKPVMARTCCPQYTIRLDAHNARTTAHQRRVIRAMNEFICTNKIPKNVAANSTAAPSSVTVADAGALPATACTIQPFTIRQLNETALRYHTNAGQQAQKSLVELTDRQRNKLHNRRRARAELRWAEKALDLAEMRQKHATKRAQKHERKSLEQLLEIETATKNHHRLTFNIVRVEDLCGDKTEMRREHKLYEAYQMHVHGDTKADCSLSQFERFLCVPMQKERHPRCGYYMGSVHLRTFIDDQLVAVSVLDVVPDGVSSVYLFYSPAHSQLTLGAYSAFIEIAYTRHLSLLRPAENDMHYYYLGFYVHGCQKMRYKLLCPEAYTFHAIRECIIKLNKTKYSRLNDDTGKVDTNFAGIEDVKFLFNQTAMSYEQLRQIMLKMTRKTELDGDFVDVCREYARLVGRNAVTQMLLLNANM